MDLLTARRGGASVGSAHGVRRDGMESSAMAADVQQDATPRQAPAASGARFGRYVLQRRLARGGMGELYLGVAAGPGGFERKVAIKRILPHLAQSESFVQRFIDEARIVVQLQHGNIVPVFDMGVHDDEYYIAMEYLAGWDLKAILSAAARRGRQLPVPLVLLVGVEVARGLAYAHRKTSDDGLSLGIVHRDISPSNILLGRDGVVKITDFGIAKAAGKLVESVAGMLQGKFAYMSPEQAAGLEIDHRSDIFSLGVILWEALTGRQLFAADSDTATLRRIRTHTPEPASALRPEIPPAVDEVLSGCLARERSGRHADAEALEQRLGALLLDHYPGTGASQLAQHLQELFPRQAYPTPAPRAPASFDDLLRAQLADLPGPEGVGDVDPGATTATGGSSRRPGDGGTPTRKGSTGRRALSPPDTRPPDADPTGFRLRAGAESAPSGDSTLSGGRVSDSPPPASRPAARGPLVWILAAALVLGGGGALVAALARPRATLELRTTPGRAYVLVDGVLASWDPTPDKGTLAIEGLPEGRELHLALVWPGFPALEHTVRVRPGEHLFLDGLRRRRPSRYVEAARAAEARLGESGAPGPRGLAELLPTNSREGPAPEVWRKAIVEVLKRSRPPQQRPHRSGARVEPTASVADAPPVVPSPPKGPTGWFGVRCTPTGRIYVPGHRPVVGGGFFELPVGRHNVRCVNDYYSTSKEAVVEVRAWPESEASDHTVLIKVAPDDQWLDTPTREEGSP